MNTIYEKTKMSLKRKGSTMFKLSNAPCKKCQIISILKSGNATKSPPIEKMKTDRFHQRWFTLGIMDLCSNCSSPKGKRSIVLSYYKDDTEMNLKGRFEIDAQSTVLSKVESVPEDIPSEYSHNEGILKWRIPNHNRDMYMIVENDEVRSTWISAFEVLTDVFNKSEQQQQEEDEYGGNSNDIQRSVEKFAITETRLSQELSDWRRSCYTEESMNAFSAGKYQEEVFNFTSLSIPTCSERQSDRGNSSHYDSGIFTESERSWRSSGASCNSWRGSTTSNTSSTDVTFSTIRATPLLSTEELIEDNTEHK